MDSLGYKTLFWSWAYKVGKRITSLTLLPPWKKDHQGRAPGAIYLLHAVSETNTAVLGDAIDHMRKMAMR